MGIEQSEKVFFTIGGTNSLILMESWLRWLIAKSITDVPGKKFDGPIYKLATWLIKLKFFQPLTTYITKCELRSNPLKVREYKRLAKILDDSIYLSLDLEYGIDYSLNDIDEVKNGNFDRKLLALMYNKSNINDNRIEYWNMHTFSNKTISPEKIHLVKVGNCYKASEILEYMRKHTHIKIKRELPFLYEYFKWLDSQKKPF